MKKFIIILTTFLFDRLTKIYLIDLQTSGSDVDFYVNPFLNIYLVWNTGIGFGLISLESNIFYHLLTFIILIINLALIFFLTKSKGSTMYLLTIIIGFIVAGPILGIIGLAIIVVIASILQAGILWFTSKMLENKKND